MPHGGIRTSLPALFALTAICLHNPRQLEESSARCAWPQPQKLLCDNLHSRRISSFWSIYRMADNLRPIASLFERSRRLPRPSGTGRLPRMPRAANQAPVPGDDEQCQPTASDLLRATSTSWPTRSGRASPRLRHGFEIGAWPHGEISFDRRSRARRGCGTIWVASTSDATTSRAHGPSPTTSRRCLRNSPPITLVAWPPPCWCRQEMGTDGHRR